MTRPARILQILQVLRESRRAVVARSLAQRFGVSQRTIYRDMQTLLELGVPVEGEAGTGFILRPGFFMPPMTFTRDEADAVQLGLRFVSARGDAGLALAARTALSKIVEGMNDEATCAMRENGLTVGPAFSGHGRQLALIRCAVKERRKLRISYLTRGEVLRDRTVWPVALGFFARSEMLAAWCELREDFRHFRTDRMERCYLVEGQIPRGRNQLLAAYRRVEPQANV